MRGVRERQCNHLLAPTEGLLHGAWPPKIFKNITSFKNVYTPVEKQATHVYVLSFFLCVKQMFAGVPTLV
ncbi:hypothetical protein V5799_013998 [Amblyomma americanum]|uniref:Uncharacterized protein n=1 Tax=Amblyomma americanum TaxID=6943 RepID=A0AAQ4E4B5_AMBAM